MFTGIIQKVGIVTQVQTEHADSSSIRLRVASGFEDLALGESIAVNGVCLTVTEFNSRGDTLFFISPETLDKSNLRTLCEGMPVNLERAVSLSTRLSGHLVQGHVDGLGSLLDVSLDAESFAVRFEIPGKLARYCVEKGSIALNGVSLTINRLEVLPRGTVAVSITLIPHTWHHTQFSRIQAGDAVNVEVDVIAKYVESLSKPYDLPKGNPPCPL